MWRAHPIYCSKGISCGGPGQPPISRDVCPSFNVFDASKEQCLPYVNGCSINKVLPNSCDSNPCQHGGVCRTPNTGDHAILCDCTPNYTGTFCELGMFLIFCR